MNHCKICKRLLDNPTDPFSLDCWGDCLLCMAWCGDDDCALTVRDWADASYDSASKEHRAQYRTFVIDMPEREFLNWRGCRHSRFWGFRRERAWRDEAKAAKRKASRNAKRLFESMMQIDTTMRKRLDNAADNREGWSTAGRTREEVRGYMFDYLPPDPILDADIPDLTDELAAMDAEIARILAADTSETFAQRHRRLNPK